MTLASERAPRHALVLALLAAMSLSACGGADDDGEQGTSTSEASTPSPSPDLRPPARQDADASDGTPIRITFGDTRAHRRGCTTTPRRAISPRSCR